MLDLDFWLSRMRLLGIIAIVISIVAWTVDLTGLVYECPYCRTQRTAIGLLGLIMIAPNPAHWLLRYLGSVFALMGLVVGAMQNFSGWKKISAGAFQLNEAWYVDPFLLSGAAIFIMTAQILLIFACRARET